MRIAVTGAGGRLGGQIIDLLADDGAYEVLAVSRRPLDQSRPGVTTAIADYLDPTALRAALDGADTLVFVTSDGETHLLLEHHHNVVHAAIDTDIAHIVVLSSLDADLASPFCYAVTNRQTELLLAVNGCAVSVARASLFTEFFLRWLVDAGRSGEIRLPAADGRVSLVSRDDVGRAMAALARSGPTGRPHDITGPEALDLPAIARAAGESYGASVDYVDITPAAYVAEMASQGEDPWWMYAFSSMFASIREQRWERTTDEVAALTGRPPTPLRAVLEEATGH